MKPFPSQQGIQSAIKLIKLQPKDENSLLSKCFPPRHRGCGFVHRKYIQQQASAECHCISTASPLGPLCSASIQLLMKTTSMSGLKQMPLHAKAAERGLLAEQRRQTENILPVEELMLITTNISHIPKKRVTLGTFGVLKKTYSC